MTQPLQIHMPANGWSARPYQQPVWDYLYGGLKLAKDRGYPRDLMGGRAICEWHRRAGKDSTGLNILATAAMMRPGLYCHILPTFKQARNIAWDGIGRDGKRMRDAFPKELFVRPPRDDEMTMWFRTEQLGELSIFKEFGSDQVDGMRGLNMLGTVFSEFAWQDPRAWDVVRPMLAENGGWALFISTPCGRNHWDKLYQTHENDPNWFVETLTVEDTFDENGDRIISEEVLAEERKSMSEELFQQEYYCSRDAGLEGAYYARAMAEALKDGRIGELRHNSGSGIWTWWDLGHYDATSIWFVQVTPREIHVLDYEEGTQKSMEEWIKIVKEKPYVYDGHVLPHDVEVHEYSTGTSRRIFAQNHGLNPLVVAPKLSPEQQIESVRAMLGRCWFDAAKCARGLNALRAYRAQRDEKKGLLMPVHDWTSHAASAFAQGATTLLRQTTRHMAPIQMPMARSAYG